MRQSEPKMVCLTLFLIHHRKEGSKYHSHQSCNYDGQAAHSFTAASGHISLFYSIR